MDWGAYNDALGGVEKKYDADVFVYSAPIDNEGFASVTEAITQKKQAANRHTGLLILTTNGGLANSAYQIARLFQQSYERFVLFTPRYCKSAGTIIALGANTIIMDVFSELGPLDVQLLDRDEIGARKSGLLTRAAFESLSEEVFGLFSRSMLGIKAASGNLISFKLAADISWRMTAELMAPIFGQLNPDIIGSDFRDLSVAKMYGERLARVSKNPKPATVGQLVADYPSHDFIIDRDEAKTLFRYIEEPSAELYAFVGLISEVTYKQASPRIVMACEPFDLNSPEDDDHEITGQDLQDAAADAGLGESGHGDRQGDQGDAELTEAAPAGSDQPPTRAHKAREEAPKT